MNPSIAFDQDSQLATELLSVLTREQACLVAGDIGAIETLVQEKLALLKTINLVATRRYELLQEGGFEASEDGMSVWLQLQSTPALNAAWLDFQKNLVQAKEMNRLNGMLINKHHSRNQQLLNTLQGSHNPDVGVYGRNGQAAPSYIRGTLIA